MQVPKSWKTTGLGITGIVSGLGIVLTAIFSGDSVNTEMLMTGLVAIGAGVTGLFAKDHDVHGGSKDTETRPGVMDEHGNPIG